MNCFEARSDFVAFWQKTLAARRRGQLLAHLSECTSCDRSFRSFALTAPVLYSVAELEWNSESGRLSGVNTHAPDLKGGPRSLENRVSVQRLSRVLPAVAVAAAAAIALYFAVPPRITFEDAIPSNNPNVETVEYASTDNFFGRELIAQGTAAPDVADE